jgi:hypothetical protein
LDQTIEIVIAPDGKPTISVAGQKGPSCLDLTAGLEKALGGRVEERRMTDEYEAITGTIRQGLHQG